MYNNSSGSTKAVCYREVSTIRGVCHKRLHCVVCTLQGGHQRKNERGWHLRKPVVGQCTAAIMWWFHLYIYVSLFIA